MLQTVVMSPLLKISTVLFLDLDSLIFSLSLFLILALIDAVCLVGICVLVMTFELLAFDGKKIKTPGDLKNIVNSALQSSDKTIEIVIYNNQNQKRSIGVKLD